MSMHDDCYGNLVMFYGFVSVVPCSDEFGQYGYVPDLELWNWLREEMDKLNGKKILSWLAQLRDGNNENKKIQ